MALTGDHKNRGELRIYDSVDEVKTVLAEYIAELSDAAVQDHGFFSLVISGGSLIDFMGQLLHPPYNKTVDWTKWYIFWADECVVSKNHEDSSFKHAKDVFLSKVPIVPSHAVSINDSVSAEEAADDYEFLIRQLVRTRVVKASQITDCPKFDLVLLELGKDGHVASLFPNHPALNEREEWVTFITDSPIPPPERITFTLPVINSASNVAVVAEGKNKADAVLLAVDEIGPDCLSIPARMVQPASGKLVWFLDRLAATKLEVSDLKN